MQRMRLEYLHVVPPRVSERRTVYFAKNEPKYIHVVSPRVSERRTVYFQGAEENDNLFHLCWRMSITFWIIRSRDQKAQDYFKEPMKRVISPIRQQELKYVLVGLK